MLKHISAISRALLKNRSANYAWEKCAKKFSTISYDESSESDGEIIPDSENLLGIEDSVGYRLASNRNPSLKPVTDPLLYSLSNCASVQEVLNFVRSKRDSLTANHLTQTVQVLFELQKIYFQINIARTDIKSSNYLQPQSILNTYITQLNAHEDFKTLLQSIEQNTAQFTLEEASVTLLYLTRMGVGYDSQALGLLINKCEQDILKTDPSMVSSGILSNFFAGVTNAKDLWSIITCLKIFPVLHVKLDECNNEIDFKFITNCLYNVSNTVTTDLINKYKEKAREILLTVDVNETNVSCFVKSAAFLNSPNWFYDSTKLIRDIMLRLKNKVYLLNEREFIALHKVYRNLHEPADMFNEIHRHASKLLVESKETSDIQSQIRLLSCVVLFATPAQRKNFENIAKKYVDIPLNVSTFVSLYRIITRLKINDKKLCDSFWNRVIPLLAVETRSSLLHKVCKNYANLAKDHVSYRNRNLEKLVIRRIETDLQETNSVVKFSKHAAFLLAFDKNPKNLKSVQESVIKMKQQFRANDCLVLLRALHVANPAAIDCSTKRVLRSRIAELTCAVDPDLNSLVALLKSNLYFLKENTRPLDKFLANFSLEKYQISSRIMQDLTYALQTSECLVPRLVDQLVDYFIENRAHVFASTSEKLLYLCYFLGYCPLNGQKFFQAVVDTILRDKERLSGLAFLQAALSLCFFNNLPDSLVKQLFSVEFLEKLDEELASCYSKEIYPFRVRHHLMQLNRAVCFDYPNANVPWFHQKYIEDIVKKGKNKKRSPHFVFVDQVLKKVVGENKYQTNVITPYGYHLDFVVHLDENDKALPDDCRDNYCSKIAILLMSSNAYTNVEENLKGQHQLKKRHLEILGYRVFLIDLKLWKLLYSPQDKIGFIQNILISGSVNSGNKVNSVS